MRHADTATKEGKVALDTVHCSEVGTRPDLHACPSTHHALAHTWIAASTTPAMTAASGRAPSDASAHRTFEIS
eukprot:365796-Chlamydomonas_euryale.AAC.6